MQRFAPEELGLRETPPVSDEEEDKKVDFLEFRPLSAHMTHTTDLHARAVAGAQDAQVAQETPEVRATLGHWDVSPCVWLSARGGNQKPPRTYVMVDGHPYMPSAGYERRVRGYHLMLYAWGRYSRYDLGRIYTQQADGTSALKRLRRQMARDRLYWKRPLGTALRKRMAWTRRKYNSLAKKVGWIRRRKDQLFKQGLLWTIAHACGDDCSNHVRLMSRHGRLGRNAHHRALRKALLASDVDEYLAIRENCDHEPRCFLNLAARKNRDLLALLVRTNQYREMAAAIAEQNQLLDQPGHGG